MLGSILRVLFGFIIACLVAGLVKVLFVITPLEVLDLPEAKMMERFEEIGALSLAAATQSAVFGAPFVLVAALIGEWQRIRGWLFYALAGMVISGAGFLAQYASEVSEQATIVNTYALAAYLSAGLIGGLAYWFVSGRSAGGRDERPTERPTPKPAAA